MRVETVRIKGGAGCEIKKDPMHTDLNVKYEAGDEIRPAARFCVFQKIHEISKKFD